MIKYIFYFLLSSSIIFGENKKITEIVRYELGNWKCSSAIETKENRYFHNSCKWSKDNYTLITDTEITEFVISINEEMINKQKKLQRQKGKCVVTKYVYKIKYGVNEYILNETLCKDDTNCFLVNKLHSIFKKLDKK